MRPRRQRDLEGIRFGKLGLKGIETMALPDEERLKQIRRSLADGGLDALLLFYPDDILMATGMLPASTDVAVLVAGNLRDRREQGPRHRLLRLVQARLPGGPRPGRRRVGFGPRGRTRGSKRSGFNFRCTTTAPTRCR